MKSETIFITIIVIGHMKNKTNVKISAPFEDIIEHSIS
jgi:hypothetical protein